MQELNFEVYAHQLTEGIRNKKERAEVEEELCSHLYDAYEMNVATGMSSDEAAYDAKRKLGTPEKLKQRLTRIHKKLPFELKQINVTMWLLGLLCIGSFTLPSQFNTFKEFEGYFLIMFTVIFLILYKMRKINKTFKAAFCLCGASAALNVCFYLRNIGYIPTTDECLMRIAADCVLVTAVWIVTVFAADKLAKKHLPEKRESNYGGIAAVGLVISLVLNLVHAVYSVFEETELYLSFELNQFETIYYELSSVFYFTCLLFSALVGVVIFFIPGKELVDRDTEYAVERFDGRFKFKSAVAAVCLIASFLSVSYVSATKKPVKEQWIINDVSAEHAETVKATREKMLSWGVPEEVVSDLPDSEILNYKDATECFIYPGKVKTSFDGKETAVLDEYYFLLPDHHGNYNYKTARMLLALERQSDENEKLYRAGLFIGSTYSLKNALVFYDNDEYLKRDIFVAVLTDEQDKTYNAEPLIFKELLYTRFPFESSFDRGLEYKYEENQRVYYAESVWHRGGYEFSRERLGVCSTTVRMKYFLSDSFNLFESVEKYRGWREDDPKLVYCLNHGNENTGRYYVLNTPEAEDYTMPETEIMVPETTLPPTTYQPTETTSVIVALRLPDGNALNKYFGKLCASSTAEEVRLSRLPPRSAPCLTASPAVVAPFAFGKGTAMQSL